MARREEECRAADADAAAKVAAAQEEAASVREQAAQLRQAEAERCVRMPECATCNACSNACLLVPCWPHAANRLLWLHAIASSPPMACSAAAPCKGVLASGGGGLNVSCGSCCREQELKQMAVSMEHYRNMLTLKESECQHALSQVTLKS